MGRVLTRVREGRRRDTEKYSLAVPQFCGGVCAFVFLAALLDLECVDPVLQLAGVDQRPQDVVVEVPEP